MSDGLTSIKVITFSGKVKDFTMWSEKFMAQANAKGYDDILDGTQKLPEEDKVTAADEKIRKLNRNAYRDLLLSMADTNEGNVAFGIVRNSKTDDYAKGDACLAWKKLTDKYEPKTAPQETMLFQKFYSSKHEKGTDPDVWISYLEDLRMRLENQGTKMEERAFLMHIMNNVQKEYRFTIQLIENDNKRGATNPLTLERLRDDLKLQYERDNGSDYLEKENKKTYDDTALYAGQFKGKCRKCGKQGHKATDCRVKNYSNGNNSNGNNNNNSSGNKGRNNFQKQNNGGGKFNGECFYCKKLGHRIGDCRKRIAEEKSGNRNEQANVVSEGRNEVSLMAYEVCLMAIDEESFDSDSTRDKKQPEGEYISHEKAFYMNEEDKDMGYETQEDSDRKYKPTANLGDDLVRSWEPSLDTNKVLKDLKKRHSKKGNPQPPSPPTDLRVKAQRMEHMHTCTSLRQIAILVQLNVNGTRKQRDNMEKQDLTIFLKTFTSFSFKEGSTNYKLYLQLLTTKTQQLGLLTIKDLLNNLFRFNKSDRRDTTNLILGQEQLEVIQRLGVDWLHYQNKPTGEHLWPNYIEGHAATAQTATAQPHKKPAGKSPLATPRRSPRFKTDYALMVTEDSYEFCMKVSNKKASTLGPNIWLGDSGASCHMTNDSEGMFDCKVINDRIKIGDGKLLHAKMMGKKRVTMTSNNKTTTIVLEEVKFVPDLAINLFSITRALMGGWQLSNKGVQISLSKNNDVLTFNQQFPTSNGVLVGIELIPESANITMDISAFHRIMGHPNPVTLKKTADYHNIKLRGSFDPCYECSIAKAKVKKTNKITTKPTSTVPGERISIDISSVNQKSYGGSKFWLLILDDATDMIWSFFLKQKSELPNKVIDFIKELKSDNKIVKYIRCDNSGENMLLGRMVATEIGHKVTMEFTGPSNPQFNGKIERKFATLYGKVRAVLNEAKVTTALRHGLWAEAANHVTDLENLLVNNYTSQCPFVMFYKSKPSDINFHEFGELAVVTDTTKIKAKLDDRGYPVLYVGRPPNHPTSVFKFLNLKTRKMISSRHIIWQNKKYGEWKNLSKEEISHCETKTDDDIDNLEDEVSDENNIPPTPPTPRTIPEILEDVQVTLNDDNDNGKENTTKLDREMKRIGAHLEAPNPDPKVIPTTGTGIFTRSQTRVTPESTPNVETVEEKEDDENGDFEVDEANIVSSRFDFEDVAMAATEDKGPSTYKDRFDVPESFKAAWHHEDSFQREKWREAIRKEFQKMLKMKVWKKIPRNQMPQKRRCVKSRWVFDIKRNGVFRARLVACGYSQVPGEDFTDIFSPVKNDVTFRIVLIAVMLYSLDCRLLDIVTAFLYGDLNEEIYMECPPGLVHEQDEILLLLKSLYGLVQSARQFFIKLVSVLKSIGFVQSIVEPCLLTNKTPYGLVIMVVHVDDCFVAGSKQALDHIQKSIQEKGLELKIENQVRDYLGCELLFNPERTKAWIGQPAILKKLEVTFKDIVGKQSSVTTPGTPNYNIVRPTEESEKVKPEEQKLYRSAVGSMLYLSSHSRPDISNVVRELAKCMDGATYAAFKEMKRVLRFLMDTKDFGLKIHPTIPQGVKDFKWNLKIFSDSDWAGDKENRHSVSGYIMYLMGVPILWKSRLQKTVALSSAEAEYYALSECAKEIKFILQLLASIDIEVEKPVVVHVDNVGAIFMAENVTATSRTRHVDARYHFVREFVEEGEIRIVFVRSEDNRSDVFTKNVNKDTYLRHMVSFLEKRDPRWDVCQDKVMGGC
jgi:Reverse transcriptase (RNA-dependent DNA polymerase)/gag-polypeptide of LTR copia-type